MPQPDSLQQVLPSGPTEHLSKPPRILPQTRTSLWDLLPASPRCGGDTLVPALSHGQAATLPGPGTCWVRRAGSQLAGKRPLITRIKYPANHQCSIICHCFPDLHISVPCRDRLARKQSADRSWMLLLQLLMLMPPGPSHPNVHPSA